jgi:hypothetical protein
MGKLIKHKWNQLTDTHKLKHATCVRCTCQKYYDDGFKCLIFVDRFNKIHFNTPSCVLPYTKIK